MKNIAFKKFYALGFVISILISVAISLGVTSIFAFRYMTHLYGQNISLSRSLIKTHRRMDLLEKRMKNNCENKENPNPISL